MSAADRERLMAQTQGLVRALALKAREKAPAGVAFDDLIGYGQVGLAEAAEAFDPKSGVRFSTFAFYRVRGSIYDGLAEMTGRSRYHHRMMRFQQRVHDRLAEAAALGDTEAAEELEADAEWLGRTSQTLAVVYLATDLGTDAPRPGEETAGGDATPDASAAEDEVRALVRRLIEELPDPDGTVMRMAYYQGMKLSEIADHFGKHKSWASRLHARVLDTLARQLTAAGAGE